MSVKDSFRENLENQLRQEVRTILEHILITSQFTGGRWVVIIDVTEAENKLVQLASDCY